MQKFICRQNNNIIYKNVFEVGKSYEGILDKGDLVINNRRIHSWDYKYNINEKKHTCFELVKKDEFILPEKWFVRVTEENKDILNLFKISKGKRGIYAYLKNLYEVVTHEGFGGTISYASIYNNCKEITFDQFRKYVLKENFDISLKDVFTPEQEQRIQEMIDKSIKQLM